MTAIRNFRPDDLPALVELRQAVHRLDHDDQPRTLDTVRTEMEWPELDPETTSMWQSPMMGVWQGRQSSAAARK